MKQDADNSEIEVKSRTRKKQEAEAAQAIGERLVTLTQKQLNQLDLPELLTDSIIQAKTIHAHGGKKRQLQFIGKLMRDEKLDMTAINQLLERLDGDTASQTAAFKKIELWRDKLLAGSNDVISEFLHEYQNVDAQLLRQTIRNSNQSKNEKLAKKSKKLIFQFIKQSIEESKGK